MTDKIGFNLPIDVAYSDRREAKIALENTRVAREQLIAVELRDAIERDDTYIQDHLDQVDDLLKTVQVHLRKTCDSPKCIQDFLAEVYKSPGSE